ncbi:MAG: polyphenol oxidase family protein [Atopobiaceae bacterium]|jgi:YfiH family protein|nr:polyphenol oxidase family protein [Atopobiaceae bacterium]
MARPTLVHLLSQGVGLFADPACLGGVHFAFTERTGGVSKSPYATLNLGDACGDDPAAVAENRHRALCALGAEAFSERLVNPRQVHGTHVVVVSSSTDAAVRAAQSGAREGADAVVCTAAGVPVLLCYADCVPIVLVCDGGFAVIHSGWRGTIANVATKALGVLLARACAEPSEVYAYVGPHIGADDYEVSAELAARFTAQFGAEVARGRHLDLGYAVRSSLEGAGILPGHIAAIAASTAQSTERFFSYRGEGGTCGRHGALAFL